jgi:hypothetical protein
MQQKSSIKDTEAGIQYKVINDESRNHNFGLVIQ